jgi:hypothetical protein
MEAELRLTAAGGHFGHAWSIDSGSLPAGVTFFMDKDGFTTLKGKPVDEGEYTVTLMCTSGPGWAKKPLKIVVVGQK